MAQHLIPNIYLKALEEVDDTLPPEKLSHELSWYVIAQLPAHEDTRVCLCTGMMDNTFHQWVTWNGYIIDIGTMVMNHPFQFPCDEEREAKYTTFSRRFVEVEERNEARDYFLKKAPVQQ